MLPISLINAEYKGDYNIFIKFNDGTSGIINLEKHLDGEIFEPLKNKIYFKKFVLDSWTIGWQNGADFAPEFLYSLLQNKH